MVKVIGFTGPTGAGKSTVLKKLEAMGAPTLDCDGVYHRLLEESEPMRQQLKERFGPEIFTAEGAVDRKALAALAFSQEQALADLNAITHPYVAQEVDAFLAKAEADGAALAGIEAVALFESGLDSRCRYTVAVTAPAEDRVARVMEREGVSQEYVQERANHQHENIWYWRQCSFAILNDGDMEKLEKRTQTLLDYIAELKQ
ncbi:MAG: dephospho-CoA kinase [Oscillospiraceae bacterium]|nr:dephospho-CoA kinase [Oscillospiraceae bacterium]